MSHASARFAIAGLALDARTRFVDPEVMAGEAAEGVDDAFEAFGVVAWLRSLHQCRRDDRARVDHRVETAGRSPHRPSRS